MVEPRMFIVSREMGSWPLMVILTVRRAVFIWGETEAMVPWTMVPFLSSMVTVSLAHFIKNLTNFMVAVGGQRIQSRRVV